MPSPGAGPVVRPDEQQEAQFGPIQKAELVAGTEKFLDSFVESRSIEQPRNPEFARVEVREDFIYPGKYRVEPALSIGDAFNRHDVIETYLEIPRSEMFVRNPEHGGMVPFSDSRGFYSDPALKGEGNRLFIPVSTLKAHGADERLRDPEQAIKDRDERTQTGFNAIIDVAEKEGLILQVDDLGREGEAVERDQLAKSCRYYLQ